MSLFDCKVEAILDCVKHMQMSEVLWGIVLLALIVSIIKSIVR